MAFPRFNFSKLWTDPAAFPTVETDEIQVRRDMQALHDEARNGLNGLMTELEARSGAASVGAAPAGGSSGSSNVQAELNSLGAAKHTHGNKALLDTYTQTEASLKSAVSNNHTHSNKSILDAVTASFTTALASAYNRLVTLFSGITSVATTLGADHTSVPTSKAVSDALTAAGSLPSGGSVNQVLSKSSASNYATVWKTITPAGIGAATAAEVAELKTSVSEGKALVAAAVTDMGVTTAANASFATLAANVKSIITAVTGIATVIVERDADTGGRHYILNLPDCIGMSQFLILAYPEAACSMVAKTVNTSHTYYSDSLAYRIDFAAGTCVYERNRVYCYPKTSNTEVESYLAPEVATTLPTFTADGKLELPYAPVGSRYLYVAW